MDLNSYFEKLAKSHVDIKHSEENKAFFREYASSRILLDTDFHKSLRFAGNNLLISQFNDDSQLPVPANDFAREQPSGSLYILSRIIDADMESARLTAIALRNDIYARIKQDLIKSVLPAGFVINTISSQVIGRMADNFFGIVLHITYTDRFVFSYTPSKWTSV